MILWATGKFPCTEIFHRNTHSAKTGRTQKQTLSRPRTDTKPWENDGKHAEKPNPQEHRDSGSA